MVHELVRWAMKSIENAARCQNQVRQKYSTWCTTACPVAEKTLKGIRYHSASTLHAYRETSSGMYE